MVGKEAHGDRGEERGEAGKGSGWREEEGG